MKITPRKSRIFCLLGAAFCALPLSLKSVTGLFLWTSPLLFLVSLLSRHRLSLFSLLGAVSLVLIFFHHRWYCKWMCPTGVLCDMLSKRSPFKVWRQAPRIGRYMSVAILVSAVFGISLLGFFDPITIFFAFFDSLQRQPFELVILKIAGLFFILVISLASPHLWCGRFCPLGGFQDMMTSFKKKVRPHSFSAGRRLILGALAGFGFNLLFRKTAPAHSAQILPPAALPFEDFQAVCFRCGNCSKVCPTDIIRSSCDLSSLSGLLTPFISYESGYCLPDCTLCGKVCPSGAIKRFSKEEKKALVMGFAQIEITKCLLSEQKECDRCQFYCEYDAISIRSSNLDFSAWPEVHKDKCVGCGACVLACPVNIISIQP